MYKGAVSHGSGVARNVMGTDYSRALGELDVSTSLSPQLNVIGFP
jgi:hypothetical protein